MITEATIRVTIEMDRMPEGVALSDRIRRAVESTTQITDRKGTVDTNILVRRISYSDDIGAEPI
jgi:hypothetical protein